MYGNQHPETCRLRGTLRLSGRRTECAPKADLLFCNDARQVLTGLLRFGGFSPVLRLHMNEGLHKHSARLTISWKIREPADIPEHSLTIPHIGSAIEDHTAETRSDRLTSLDVMRGLIVAAMIVVNFSLGEDGFGGFPVYPTLVHAEWIGFTFADFVFPAFLFMVGMSISLTAPSNAGLDAASMRRICMRTIRLFALGFLLSNFLYLWIHGWAFDGRFIVMGVLQRIGLCYGAAAILYRTVSVRTLGVVASALLVVYWPLTLIPTPDHLTVNLAVPGMNFVAWVDRTLLGRHVWVAGPSGYDTAGLLSTLPAIAQCLLGVSAGRLFNKDARTSKGLARFLIAGVLMSIAGLIWGHYFPIIKSLWTSSFVLLSTGLSMVLLTICQALLNRDILPVSIARFFIVFGRNAILAYALQFVLDTIVLVPIVPAIHRLLLSFTSATFASLCIAIAFMILIWVPLAALYRQNRIVHI
jgi:predicted acyltransferase